MELLVAFDIADDARRRRVGAVLKARGDRIQRSVFVLRHFEAATLGNLLEPLLDEAVDVVMVWALPSTVEPAWQIGSATVAPGAPFVLIE